MLNDTQFINPYAVEEDTVKDEQEFINPYAVEEVAPEEETGLALDNDEFDPLAPSYDFPEEPVRSEEGQSASFGDLISDVGMAVSEIPSQIAGSAAALIEGGDPEDIFNDKDWTDRAIEKAREGAENARIDKKYGGDDTYTDFLGIKITRNDVRNFSQNASFSLVTMAASVSAWAVSLPVPIPGSTIAATGLAGGASGYRLDTNSVMRDLRQGMDAEANKQIGRKLTDKEFIVIANAPEMQAAAKKYGVKWSGKGNIKSLVREHGLHEAGWEALGNIVSLGAGKILFKAAQKSGILKPILAAGGALTVEIGSEAETQLGQNNTEIELGINPEGKKRSYFNFEDQKTSAGEVAGPTALLVGGMGAGAYGAGKLSKLARRRKKKDEGDISNDELDDLPDEDTPSAAGEIQPDGTINYEPADISGLKEPASTERFQKDEEGVDYNPAPAGGLGLIEMGEEQAGLVEAGNSIEYDKVDLLDTGLTAETNKDADKRVAQDARITEQEDQLKGVKLPEGFEDNRLKRLEFRDRAKISLDEMIEGGGLGLIPNPNFIAGESDKPGEVPMVRMKSQNPSWVQSLLEETGMSVAQVKKAVNKALKGEKLGIRQALAVERVLDQISDERTGGEHGNLDYAKQELEKARQLRDDYAQGAFAEPTDDWLFEELNYSDELDSSGRIIYELIEEARKYGEEAEDKMISVAERALPDQVLIAELSQIIREYNGYDQQEYEENAGPESGQALPVQQEEGYQANIEKQGAAGIEPDAGFDAGFTEPSELDQEFAEEPAQEDITEPLDIDAVVERELEEKEEFIRPDVSGLPEAAIKQDKKDSGRRKEGVNGRTEERRTHKVARDVYSEMSKEELLDALLTHELTGIKGRRSFVVELENAENVISIDADSLKWFNDNMSPDSGDKLLQSIADTLVEEVGKESIYHISGDEFYALDTGQGIEVIESAINAAQERLKEAVIHVTKEDGTKITKTGVEFTYGTGETKKQADNELKKEKINREKQGLRAAREQEPAGVVVEPAEGKPDNKSGRAEEEIAKEKHKGVPDAALKEKSQKKSTESDSQATDKYEENIVQKKDENFVGKGPTKTYGKNNKIFTEAAAEKARAILKRKLNSTFNSGLDPEIVQAGITLAGYYIESGVRTFSAYSKAMTDDLGGAVKPYLRSWYEGVRYYPEMDVTDMTPSSDIPVESISKNKPIVKFGDVKTQGILSRIYSLEDREELTLSDDQLKYIENLIAKSIPGIPKTDKALQLVANDLKFKKPKTYITAKIVPLVGPKKLNQDEKDALKYWPEVNNVWSIDIELEVQNSEWSRFYLKASPWIGSVPFNPKSIEKYKNTGDDMWLSWKGITFGVYDRETGERVKEDRDLSHSIQRLRRTIKEEIGVTEKLASTKNEPSATLKTKTAKNKTVSQLEAAIDGDIETLNKGRRSNRDLTDKEISALRNKIQSNEDKLYIAENLEPLKGFSQDLAGSVAKWTDRYILNDSDKQDWTEIYTSGYLAGYYGTGEFPQIDSEYHAKDRAYEAGRIDGGNYENNENKTKDTPKVTEKEGQQTDMFAGQAATKNTPEEKPKGTPLSEIKVTIKARVEETGEFVDIIRPADVELQELDARLGDLKQLRNCII